MQNIKDLISKGQQTQGPYQPPLKVLLATRSHVINYKRDNVDKSMIYLALCDESGFVKATHYEPEKIEKFANGTAVVIKNYIFRSDKTIALTSQSKPFKTSALVVPERLLTEAVNSVRPATPPPMPISQIQYSPEKTMASVIGVVQQDEVPRNVLVRGQEVPIRALVLGQQQDKIKVSLWRKDANAPVQSGGCVAVTTVVVKKYQGETQLSSTRTKVQKTEMPSEETLQEVIAYNDEENFIQLLMANDMTIKVQEGLLRQVLQVETPNDWQEVLDALLPIRAAITT